MDFKLKESESNLKNLVENIHDIVFQLSPLGIIEYVSPKIKDRLGYEPEDIVGHHLKINTPASEIPKALGALKRVYAGEEIVNFPIKQRHADGTILSFEINGKSDEY